MGMASFFMVWSLSTEKPGFFVEYTSLKLRCCTIVKNRQDASSTRKFISCGTGILPVPKQVIENGARCQLQPTETVKTRLVSERLDA